MPLKSPSENEDASEALQDAVEQVVEALRELELKASEVTVNVPKAEVRVDVQVPQQAAPVVNVSSPDIKFPQTKPHPFVNGAKCIVTKRNSYGFIEEFTIKPIKS